MAKDFKTPHAENQDAWARIKPFKDPVSGKQLNTIGDGRPQSQVNPRPVGADYGGGLKDGSRGPKDVV
ncbi:hypothetical protein ACFPFP_02940 [Bradyrhizobium sp. GCM10023182]|uniref:Uncharacterized protein n=1 Tax=Bradyrhizobium zhengyangense TaxID=2911009 RepID=A0ABS9LFW7_9BRAD|nr:hypothetical protein [Bradyrhizobium zhengyangense]MCG2665885.1 hypothetical protein [Bradyrhizobium zhengyangense]